MKDMAIKDVSDHPDIRSAERTGYPSYERDRVIFRCDECGESIYEGDTYYRIGDSIICDECIREAKSIA